MHKRIVLVVLFTSLSAIQAEGQGVVQQPVVEQFRVDTAVGVPDHGSALLGSVSKAHEGTRSYGPLPWGTSSGRELSHTATRVHVLIHDFELLDQQLLFEAEQNLGLVRGNSSDRSRHALASEILKQRAGSSDVSSSHQTSSRKPEQQSRRAKALEILRNAR